MRYLFLLFIILISCHGQNSILPNEINNPITGLNQIKNTRFFVSNNSDFNQKNTTFHYKKDSLSGIYFNESVGNFYRISSFITETNAENNIESYPIKFNGLNGIYYLERENDTEQISIHFGNDTIINSIKAVFNQKTKANVINFIKSASFDIKHKIDYGKIFSFKLNNSNTSFKAIEYNPNVIIYSTEKLVTAENPFYIDKIYVSEFYNKNVDDIVRDYLNNIDENIYQLELNEQPETTIDNLPTTHFTLTGTATLNHPNGQNMSKNVSIDFYFVEKGKKLYVIRTEIFNNNQNAVKEVEKILQTIKFQ
ncbi:hypothetical protein HXZ94_00660 [Empedobacter falsenii]|uniref:hypothetical protein n=1 Tax=Empedobacter falsenii TaxID=343874 RepID=UPI0025776CB2|nr:hypothetical protein [Empedobacter falsenii]MDM1297016.1 hypothetical protein [Empedobacter falsenii]MDM1316809.1 hypothetical protein [Empedobacter falsenii]